MILIYIRLSRQKLFGTVAQQVDGLLVILACYELFFDADMLDILGTFYVRRDS